MTVTKREILFSIIILSAMMSIGVLISTPIISSLSRKALMISSSVQAKDSLKFGYIGRTEAGNFLAEGDLISINPIIYDIPGKYMEVKKVKERYTKHVQVHTRSDGKGHTSTYTTTSYSWDIKDKDVKVVDSILFLGQRFKLKEVNFKYNSKRDTTIYEKNRIFGAHEGDIRYVYYTYPESTFGLLQGKATEKTYIDLKFLEGKTIEKTILEASKDIQSIPIIFWVLWIILTSGIIFGFVYLENDWLEDNKKKE